MTKRLAETVYYVLLISIILLMLFRLYRTSQNDLETAGIIWNVIIALAIGAVILRIGIGFFPKWFKDRPTREELDEKEN